MSIFETSFLIAAGVMYVSSFFLARKGRSGAGFSCVIAALAFQLVAVVVRWTATGHPPVFGTYEAALAASWFLLLFVAASFHSIHGHFRLMVLTAVPMALLVLVYGLGFNTERMPITISEMSLWVDFHALFAWLAFAPFTLACCLSGYYLWSTRGDGAQAKTPHPPLEIIDELAFRYINFGFINHSVMFAIGSYYSSVLMGRWWQWDPVFSLSLLAWLGVALYIHMRHFYNWNGKRAARLFIGVFITIMLSYWLLAMLPPGQTFHVFDLEF